VKLFSYDAIQVSIWENQDRPKEEK